ncbi:DUF2290 domain-containing protein [Pseudidiomarina insulisalsae]|nr:DUF2290 domain-containing protein [Pseudidiomarina insulisalsae]
MITRLTTGSLSVQFKFPSEKRSGDLIEYGGLKALRESAVMKSIPYKDIYDSLIENDAFHVKLIDGSLMSFQYAFFANSGKLAKHRLLFFPSPKLPEYDSNYKDYLENDLYIDAMEPSLVKFPVRFDFDPKYQKSPFHPASHLTLGQYKNCRIPVSMPVSPRKFTLFIIRNFYHTNYRQYKNMYDKKDKFVTPVGTITSLERDISHFIL